MVRNDGVNRVALTVLQAAYRGGGLSYKEAFKTLTCSGEWVLLWVSAGAGLNPQPKRHLVAQFVNSCPACFLQMKRLRQP